MKTWAEVAMDYFDKNAAPVCPECGSKNVDTNRGVVGQRVWVDFSCKNCGSCEHLDGYLEK